MAGIAMQQACESREVWIDRSPRKSRSRETQHAMSRLICLENATDRVGGDDSGGTAFDQCFQLFFGFASGLALAFDFVEMAEDDLAVLGHLIDKHSYTKEGRKIQNVARSSGGEMPGKRIEELSEDRTQQRNARDQPRAEDPAHH